MSVVWDLHVIIVSQKQFIFGSPEETIKSCNIGQIDDVRKPVSYGELSTRRDWTKNAGKTLFSREKSENGKSPFYFSHIISEFSPFRPFHVFHVIIRT